MKTSMKKIKLASVAGFFAVVLSVGLVLGCEKDSAEVAASAEEQLLAVEAKPGSVSVVVEGPSVVEPYRVQMVRSRVESTVMESPSEGDAVGNGDVLVRFDSTDQQKALRQAQIALSQARVNRDKAADSLEASKKDLSDKETLLSSGAVPEDQVREARDSVVSAQRSLELAELNVSQAALALETAQDDLAATVIRAPFDGVVLSTALNPGDLVSRGALLLTFADLSRVRLQAEVDEFDIGKVEIGQSVSISSEAIGESPLKSKVERISPAAEVVNNISIFKVSTLLANEDGRLRPGMSADISILISADKGLVVPSKAVSSVRTRSYLKVFKDPEIETRRVEIGADDGVNVVVLEGLEEGELVVVPSTAGFSLTSTQTSSGTSVIPISVPGSGATK
jgi:HlyD family secretion protein